MRIASVPSALAGLAVAGFFVARAVTGVPAAWASRRGEALEDAQRYAEATPLLDRGAVGGARAGTLWHAGRTQIEYWYTLHGAERDGPRGEEVLRRAMARFLRARVASPGSAWSTAEIADLYACRESVVRARRVPDLAALENGPWPVIGDDGRVALGLSRAAVAREPNNCEMRDRLVLLLEENGLRTEALAAMAESARVLPDFDAHPQFSFESLPLPLVEAFWRAAREVGANEAPMLPRVRQLLTVGQLGRRLGHLEEAEADLRAALHTPDTKLAHAEVAFHLGLVLVDLGRLDEAETMLAQAVQEPVFIPGVASTRARIAVKRERWADALEQYRYLRALQPRETGVLLAFAWAAQKAGAWDQAEEALRWAVLVHPDDPAPRRALVQMFLDKGEIPSARRALDDYILDFGKTDDTGRLAQALALPLAPAQR